MTPPRDRCPTAVLLVGAAPDAGGRGRATVAGRSHPPTLRRSAGDWLEGRQRSRGGATLLPTLRLLRFEQAQFECLFTAEVGEAQVEAAHVEQCVYGDQANHFGADDERAVAFGFQQGS